MKKHLLAALTLAGGFAFQANAQEQRGCAAHEIFEQKMATDVQFARNQANLERKTAALVEEFRSGRMVGSQIVIPCIVHVVYNTSQQNISDAQIASQIARLNADYAGTNSDVNNTPAEFSRAGDTNIRFELMEVKRYQNSRTSWGTNDAVKQSYPPIEPDRILNMWVCEIGGGILGYAQFPGGSLSTDGVVMSPQYFGDRTYTGGSNFFLSAPFDRGRTATHEVGHWLNLRHIWGDGNCNADDFVTDTPKAGAANYGCPSYPSKSCSTNGGFTSDMFMNYMDYTDDACMFMFSAGQKARMLAAIDASRPGLKLNPTYTPGGSTGGGGGTTDPGTGVETCGSASNISVSRRKWVYYSVTIPAGATKWVVSTSGGSGDADLYVRFGTSNPTTSTNNGSSAGSTNNESITINNPTAGTWRIGIYGYSASSGITLRSCVTAPSARTASGNANIDLNFESEGEDQGVSLFPNPASSVLNVALTEGAQQLEIYSMTGQVVFRKEVAGKMESIDVSALENGIYVVKVADAKGVSTQRFVKQ
jgi:hypothetical protein